MARPTKLTPETQAKIVIFDNTGALNWVAAQAAGIAPTTFYRWMAEGKKASSGLFHNSEAAGGEARASTRMRAEIAVFEDNPIAWLRYGPGRERDGEPGWTESVKSTSLSRRR